MRQDCVCEVVTLILIIVLINTVCSVATGYYYKNITFVIIAVLIRHILRQNFFRCMHASMPLSYDHGRHCSLTMIFLLLLWRTDTTDW